MRRADARRSAKRANRATQARRAGFHATERTKGLEGAFIQFLGASAEAIAESVNDKRRQRLYESVNEREGRNADGNQASQGKGNHQIFDDSKRQKTGAKAHKHIMPKAKKRRTDKSIIATF